MESIKKYQVTKELGDAEQNSYEFVESREKSREKTGNRKERIEEIGKTELSWNILCIVGVIVTIGFCILESNMAQNALLGFLDPNNEHKSLYLKVASFGGVSFALSALLSGHIFSKNIESQVNPITGRRTRRLGFHFFLSVIYILIYCALQYHLVRAAGNSNKMFHSYAMLLIVLALVEIIFGALVLDKALSYIMLGILAIQIGIVNSRMRKTARNTNDRYRDYRMLRDEWNKQNPDNQMELEGSANIWEAINHYGGGNPPNATNSETEREVENFRNDNPDDWRL
jgi:hypothetical protein